MNQLANGTSKAPIQSQKIYNRANTLLNNYLGKIYKQSSFIFCCMMLVQWVAAILSAYFLSPAYGIGSTENLYPQLWIAFFGGGLIALLPISLAIKNAEAIITRHSMAVAQMLFSALFIYLSGGEIVTHFHVFASLAFLSLYRDWRILVTAAFVTITDQAVRGHFLPLTIYGEQMVSNWRIFEHAFWILIENSALVLVCKRAVSELESIAESQAMLESTKIIIEEQVKQRTEDLLKVQRDLEEARDKAIELSKVKSEFLANMSHEIRTPMNGIIGTLDIVMESKLDPEQYDLLRTGYNSAKSLLTIINDILDVSKIESGKFSISPVTIDVEKFLSECERMMSPLIIERDIVLVINKTDKVPQFIHIDETRLRQIIINLIGNSVKFTMAGGGILMMVDAIEREDDKLELHFSVSDSGRGIEKSKCDLIFEAFSQADNTVARKHGGTGLGLTISKAIVEMMGGKLWVKSREKVGSTFQFFVIAERSERSGIEKSDEFYVPNTKVNPNRSNILLAEDNLVNQKITVKLLEKRGYKVKVVENGQLALEALSQNSFDLVLMDVQMPVMDGIEAIKQIRNSKEAWSKVPIIALTAHALSGDKENLLSIGADGYLSKPLDKNSFFQQISSFTRST